MAVSPANREGKEIVLSSPSPPRASVLPVCWSGKMMAGGYFATSCFYRAMVLSYLSPSGLAFFVYLFVFLISSRSANAEAATT